MNAEEVMAAWGNFAAPNDFMLNPDREHVATVLEGVLASQQACGLRLCPCRLRDGSRERDLGLLCPCNFKRHDSRREEGRCWCGLFVKKE
jgi:ferredoxin-thioredoxin reductase catalytic chain